MKKTINQPQGIVIHVGLPKTGTTTLQDNLFLKHQEIFLLGKSTKFKARKSCRSEKVYELLASILWNQERNFNPTEVSRLYRDTVLPEVGENQTIVVSWEALGVGRSQLFRQKLERFVNIFGPCKMMMMLRHPIHRLTSEYLQNLKGHYLLKNRRWMGNEPFIEFDEWYERRSKHNNTFSYMDNISTAAEIIGKQNIGLFLFEELVKDPENYHRSVCRFMGIDEEEGVDLSRNRHHNPRITTQQLERLQKDRISLKGRLLYRFGSKKKRQQRFQNVSRNKTENETPAEIHVPDEIALEICTLASPGNRKLQQEFSLPLEKYGYPI